MRGYTVIEASGGEAALDIVRTHKGAIDLLISDVVMPNMDGPTLVRAASRLRPEMRIIFMSGYAEEAFRKNDEKAEERHFLPKPFGLKQLVAKVKEVLSGATPTSSATSLSDTGT
jgi:two-component system cell cycle sensor histidine kinase/response regulator CckA